MHMPNGMMLTMGMWSMIVAAGCCVDCMRLIGSTVNVDGATPNVHVSVAVLTTWGTIRLRARCRGQLLVATISTRRFSPAAGSARLTSSENPLPSVRRREASTPRSTRKSLTARARLSDRRWL